MLRKLRKKLQTLSPVLCGVQTIKTHHWLLSTDLFFFLRGYYQQICSFPFFSRLLTRSCAFRFSRALSFIWTVCIWLFGPPNIDWSGSTEPPPRLGWVQFAVHGSRVRGHRVLGIRVWWNAPAQKNKNESCLVHLQLPTCRSTTGICSSMLSVALKKPTDWPERNYAPSVFEDEVLLGWYPSDVSGSSKPMFVPTFCCVYFLEPVEISSSCWRHRSVMTQK
jgi:hypothetical protein